MALFNETSIRDRAKQERLRATNIYKSNNRILSDSASTFNKYKTYDIFLSHSSKDAELILGVKVTLEDMGYSVYVDWVEDSQLDRESVNETTAELLRERMDASKSLFYVTTENSESSKWMPWECGYFDGIKEKVAILPIKKYSYDNDYNGQEYLGLYPYCVKQNNTQGKSCLWVYKNRNFYMLYETWLEKSRRNLEWRRIG
ncbi:TIR domain-containing protein [Photobacterium iliopiscarium]|uniref:TIR domain-containing protein n=1 Tax=Photobacterium iliopiscarium TaxID=56192 RepID=UPI0009E272A1|nr:TIR domain-containing protein [Photobacterium iliopiscarium]PSU01299.1 toll/interleukin-1 receptor domain-containing protein [Photobacterium iliopiscarium]PSV83793.1 toll/interleukin-1 receptor domain-containing protein [Photobacterium iliopiscarium]